MWIFSAEVQPFGAFYFQRYYSNKQPLWAVMLIA